MEYFFNIFIIYLFNVVVAKWLPDLNFQPDFNQFHIYELDPNQNNIYKGYTQQLQKSFDWQTVGSFSLSSLNSSFIVYGGSQQKSNDSNSAFNKNMSVVVLCELKQLQSPPRLGKVTCEIQEASDSRYLGAAVKAISLSNNEAVLVYCDPLWHKSDKIEPKPSGKCYLRLVNDKDIIKRTEIEFCKLSLKSYVTCMAGFSVDLISINNALSGVEMIVGMPHKIPYGGVNVVQDPFGTKIISVPKKAVGKYYNFGYAVSMTKNGFIYVSSPISDQYFPNVTEIRDDTQMINPDHDQFSSFGVALTTLLINNGKNQAVVVGAPFHTSKSIQNVGKVYIFCTTPNNRSYLSASVYGREKDEFFGYSLANIGDINGDGNDDVAISSPFLRDNDARGYVSIYTVNGKCEIKEKPHQILKTKRPEKIGIFGISISGGSDMDFNGWPDIVVTSTKSNSIEMFVSRSPYEAQCKSSIETNYETQALNKDESIKIKIYLSILDKRKGNFINIRLFERFKLVSQIDPNLNVTVNRFELGKSPIEIKFITQTDAMVTFFIKSLQHVRDMNLTDPIKIAYRFVEDCQGNSCKDVHFPLIDWGKCVINFPVRKFICSNTPICNADLAIELNDKMGNEVVFGYDRSYQRSIEMKIFNFGPTEAKDINFKISTFQNLRISKIYLSKDLNIKDVISSNQTEGVVKLDQLEIDVNSLDIIINIDLYFMDFKDQNRMKYENNSIIIQLFSDVIDANLTNNIARIDYIFVYEPNITFFGSSKQDTVVDTRNRSQPLRRGQRIAIDTIGPRFSQTYSIYNVGKGAITNMTVKISMPMITKDNLHILYLFDKIRGLNNSMVTWMSIVPQVTVGSTKYTCRLPPNYVNPLDIIGFETHESHLADIDMSQIDGSLHYRRKRSEQESAKKDSMGSESDIKNTQGKMNRIPVELIRCNRLGTHLSSPICADIVCEIPLIPSNKNARIQINAWLLAHTFFKKQISDIMVYTTLEAEFRVLPQGVILRYPKGNVFPQYQQFIFKNVKPKLIHETPMWPIIVGIVIGILILAILIVAMYKCGFFKRDKRRRHFRSTKSKRNEPVILHPADMQTSSSTEAKFTSHSNLINNQ